MKAVGYIRVSKEKQAREGVFLELEPFAAGDTFIALFIFSG